MSESFKEKKYPKILKYYPSHDAYFMYKKIKYQTSIMSWLEFSQKVNDGTLPYESYGTDFVREDAPSGQVLIGKKKFIPPTDKEDTPGSGIFQIVRDDKLDYGIQKIKIESDKYISLDDKYSSKINIDLKSFFENRKAYKDMGLLHKRGLLLYGPPGNGKTMLIKHIANDFIKDKDIRVLVIPSYTRVSFLSNLRQALSDMYTIFVFEELTTIASSPADCTAFLNFLDGEESWDKSFVIATTNYPESLPGNLVDRPSRFDSIYKIGVPSADTRRKYLTKVMGKNWVTDKIVRETNGLSIAYLKELTISCKIHKKDPLVIIASFFQRKKDIKEEFETKRNELGLMKKNMGFGSDRAIDDDDDYDD